jgi:predicted NodU family carbamoyl transferase
MVTLGAYIGDHGCAAALAVDGRVVSAVSDTSGHHARGQRALPSACVEQILGLSGLNACDISSVVLAEDGPPAEHHELAAALGGKPIIRVARLHAEAAQLRGEAGDGIVLAVDGGFEGHSAIFSKSGGTLRCLQAIPGMREMLHMAGSVAAALGDDAGEPWTILESCYGNTEESIETALNAALWAEGDSIHVDEPAVERLLADARQRCPAPLEARDSVHVGVQRTRAALATSTLNRIGDVLSEIARATQTTTRGDFVGFSGSAFESATLTARVASRIEAAVFAPIPERIGAALGAALLPHDSPTTVRHLSLGPAYSDQEIKADLENCRLDYVYEPDWSKLLTRASDLLRSGATLAWFQGNLEFGQRSFGSRSILCDPSSQYARENVNVFLLHREVSAALPVSMAAAAAPNTPGRPHAVRFGYASAPPVTDRRNQLTSAIDRHGRCLMHVTDEAATPELHKLLDLHYARTGVPGLIAVPLTQAGCLARTPRDAVREAFGSAIDALVIGRFLVSKDYWLLRSRTS